MFSLFFFFFWFVHCKFFFFFSCGALEVCSHLMIDQVNNFIKSDASYYKMNSVFQIDWLNGFNMLLGSKRIKARIENFTQQSVATSNNLSTREKMVYMKPDKLVCARILSTVKNIEKLSCSEMKSMPKFTTIIYSRHPSLPLPS